ncbi:MAG: 3-dehydroquinate synthase [Sphingobacteriaceae bacterium]|nr:3-dehydroquinate synthase [Sphingobacteriaceae bacterium]
MTKNSTIIFDTNTFSKLNSFLKKGKYSRLIVLADSNTINECYPILAKNCALIQKADILEIDAGEAIKTLDACKELWETLSEAQVDKNALLVNVGGGVITDIGGFVASVYKRGIDFIHIPTSLLAMADASVGGKCGVDLNSLKNQLGTITQPKAVFINTLFLNTLPQRQLANGVAEIIKMGLIADAKLVKAMQDNKTLLDTLIKRSVALKMAIVKKDPNDKSVRKILNFGHTIGHAIESYFLGTKDELLHGEAIAIGMFIESLIAFDKKMIKTNELQTIVDLIKPNYQVLEFSQEEEQKIIELMLHDKKNKNNKIRMSLINKIGSCKYDVEVNVSQIQKAFKTYHQIIGA